MPQVDAASPDYERQILEEAIQSPSVAMMRLSLEIDRQLRLILAVVGLLREYSGGWPTDTLDLISRTATASSIPPVLRDILKSFWDLRNSVIHGGGSHHGLAMRAVDYGLRILRLLQSIPRPSFIVVAKVPVCADQTCTNLRPDVDGVILQSFGTKAEDFGRHIYPTRKGYIPGQSVSWEWALNGPGWGETWFREPDTGEVKLAWREALEFIGRPLEEI